jgi:hypothetical protein
MGSAHAFDRATAAGTLVEALGRGLPADRLVADPSVSTSALAAAQIIEAWCATARQAG